MRRGNVSLFTTRLRMERIEERTNSTKMPPIESLFRSCPEDPDFLKLIVENMTFSDYPGAKLGNASSLASFLMNGNNISELRASGCLGAILEILRRTNIEENPDSDDVKNLVQSLHIITKDDLSVQKRLMNHPSGLSSVLRLCKRTQGHVQVLSFDILEWLGKLEADSQQKLLDKNIIKILLKPAFMYRQTTVHEVRRRAAQMVRALIAAAPDRMRIYDFAEICVDSDGRRRIDGEMEVWLLAATTNHIHWWTRCRKDPLPKVFTLFRHLLAEVLSESFESIEHMQLILRCCSMVSNDPEHIRFMLANGLGAALQYLVRTDFNLFRPKTKKTIDTSGSEREKLRRIASQFKTKKKSILDSGDRPASTLMFLSLVKPNQASSVKKHEDINYFVTKYVCNLFENIVEFDTDVISELVGSGLVPALVFRVGKGRDRDMRFNKLVVHFLHHIFYKVTMAQSHKGQHISQLKSDGSAGANGVRKAFFWPRGQSSPFVSSANSEVAATTIVPAMIDDADDVAAVHARRMKEQSVDLAVVSNTLCAHGVADLLLVSLQAPSLEEPQVVREAIATLAMMKYSVFNDTAVKLEYIDALFLIYRTRSDCFYQFLCILCEMIQYPDALPEVLDELVVKHKAIRTLIRALQMSGWVFHEKDFVYRCFGKLTVLPHFVQSVREVEGISVLCREVSLRKLKMRQGRRGGLDDDDGTERLLSVLRPDLAATRLQSLARRRLAFRRVCVLLGKKDPGARNRALVNSNMRGKSKKVSRR